MSQALKAIHIAKRELGMLEDDYRAMLGRVTGKRSAGPMSEAERGKVLDEMKRLGFKARSGSGRNALEGKYAKKLQALWISAWNLGIVRNRDDKALIAFVKRQTGVDHVRFVHDAADAARAIEALKSWMTREAGVRWPVKSETAEIAANDPGFDDALHARHRVLDAIARQLREAGAIYAGYIEYLIGARRLGQNHWRWTAAELDDGIRLLGAKLRKAKA